MTEKPFVTRRSTRLSTVATMAGVACVVFAGAVWLLDHSAWKYSIGVLVVGFAAIQGEGIVSLVRAVRGKNGSGDG